MENLDANGLSQQGSDPDSTVTAQSASSPTVQIPLSSPKPGRPGFRMSPEHKAKMAAARVAAHARRKKQLAEGKLDVLGLKEYKKRNLTGGLRHAPTFRMGLPIDQDRMDWYYENANDNDLQEEIAALLVHLQKYSELLTFLEEKQPEDVRLRLEVLQSREKVFDFLADLKTKNKKLKIETAKMLTPEFVITIINRVVDVFKERIPDAQQLSECLDEIKMIREQMGSRG